MIQCPFFLQTSPYICIVLVEITFSFHNSFERGLAIWVVRGMSSRGAGGLDYNLQNNKVGTYPYVDKIKQTLTGF